MLSKYLFVLWSLFRIMSRRHNFGILNRFDQNDKLWVQTLDIRNLDLTVQDVCTILNTLLNLETLHHPLVVCALHEIYREHILQRPQIPEYQEHNLLPQLPVYKLLNLEIIEDKLIDCMIQLDEDYLEGLEMVLTICLNCAVCMCPYLKVVDIGFENDISPTNLKPLLKLNQLESLIITLSYVPCGYVNSVWVPFMCQVFQDILPILQQNGSRMKLLHLDGISDVDLGAILHLCPNLEWLGVMRSNICQSPSDFPQLRHLKTLYIGNDLKEYQYLLSSPLLKEVFLRCSHGFNLRCETLLSLLQNSKHLEFLSIFLCPHVKQCHFESMLSNVNALNTLHVNWCENISATHAMNVLSLANNRNLDIFIAIRDPTRRIFYTYLPCAV